MSGLKINVAGKTVLVTGSNRGIGKAILIELLERGAKKVYAGARNITTLDDLKSKYGERLIPIQLDVTNEQDITNAAALADDVEILINNAGVGAYGGFFGEGAIAAFDQNLAVNVYGLINLTKAFVQTLKEQEEAAIVNISSVAGLASMPVLGTYSATKATVHSITQSFRGELAQDNILVSGVYPGPIDTDMAKDFDMPKDSPENAAKAILDGLAEGKEEIYPDPMSTQVGEGYSTNPKGIEQEFAAYVG